MPKNYYTYRISVANHERVQVEKLNPKHRTLGKPSGRFRYQEKIVSAQPILEIARNNIKNELNDRAKIRELGETLFEILFDNVLRQDFVNFYNQVVREENQFLRVELDVDEQVNGMSKVAALPWEFMCLPQKANLGEIRLGTDPNTIFSRRRSQWFSAQPIQLKEGEGLRIALIISEPSNLPTVMYRSVQDTLEKLVNDQTIRIESLDVVSSANPDEIDEILRKKPHIFHFIGHGRLKNAANHEIGQIALIDPAFDEVMWVDADYFSSLFATHCPGIVILQACEGGMLSASAAFSGVASRVVQMNIPVVVAMQYEISNISASRFARKFYERLAKGDPVDVAVQNGRRAIALGPTQYRKRDFATPIIFMRIQDGYLFQHYDSDNKIGVKEQTASATSDSAKNASETREIENNRNVNITIGNYTEQGDITIEKQVL